MKQISLRVDQELFDKVKASAKKNRRSLNNEILNMMDRGLPTEVQLTIEEEISRELTPYGDALRINTPTGRMSVFTAMKNLGLLEYRYIDGIDDDFGQNIGSGEMAKYTNGECIKDGMINEVISRFGAEIKAEAKRVFDENNKGKDNE